MGDSGWPPSVSQPSPSCSSVSATVTSEAVATTATPSNATPSSEHVQPPSSALPGLRSSSHGRWSICVVRSSACNLRARSISLNGLSTSGETNSSSGLLLLDSLLSSLLSISLSSTTRCSSTLALAGNGVSCSSKLFSSLQASRPGSGLSESISADRSAREVASTIWRRKLLPLTLMKNLIDMSCLLAWAYLYHGVERGGACGGVECQMSD